MKIDHYSFGKIIINGKTYTSDVIIYPERVNPSWWRKEGHLLQIPDLEEVMASKVSVLIIGNGFYGTMRVPEEVLNHLKSKGIEAHVADTRGAVKLYNEMTSRGQVIVAALHLTC